MRAFFGKVFSKQLFAKKGSKSRFPLSIFWIVLAMLVSTASIHVGIILALDKLAWHPIIQTHVVILYWLGAAFLLTLLIRSRMKAVYDTPLQEISAATKKVAHGDFTVRIDPLHDPGEEDYLDTMIQDLNAMIAELGSIEPLKTDFVSNVSHEIKTPLSVIQNYSSLLCTKELSEEDRLAYASVITGAAMRLNSLITNILRLNRLENQKIHLNEEVFDLGGQLTECLLGFETVWEEKGIEIDPDIADDVLLTSDKELLSIVWNNLLSNAFKFTGSGGNVGICLRAEGDHALVSVCDTGCGIPPETVQHIFDKFYQGDTSHSVQGNGLGLALVRRIVEIAGGEITVESVPGKGSRFTVRIPMGLSPQDEAC